MTPLDRHIERLQAMRAAGNGSSDFATDLLDVLDECEPWLNGDQELSTHALDDIAEHLKGVPTSKRVSSVVEKAEWLASEMDELQSLVDAHGWGHVTQYVRDLVDFRADLLMLLADAGIAEPNVMPDDPIGILRMFLPVE